MSHQVIRIVPPPAPLLRIAKRVLVGAALIAMGYVGAQVAPSPVDSIFAAGFHGAASTRHAGPESLHAAPGTDAAQRDFDYFPDHYQNQATEVAEPIDTF